MKQTNTSTEPSLKSQGVSTRGEIRSDMSNNPKGAEFTGIFYSGAKQPEPSSPGVNKKGK